MPDELPYEEEIYGEAKALQSTFDTLFGRYPDAFTNEEVSTLTQRIEDKYVEIMNSEVSHLERINNILEESGSPIDTEISVEPNEFLEFVLANSLFFLDKSISPEDIYRYNISASFYVYYDEVGQGAYDDFVELSAVRLRCAAFLTEYGIDVTSMEFDQLKELLDGDLRDAYEDLVDTALTGKGINVLLKESLTPFASYLKREFSELSSSLLQDEIPEDTFVRMFEVLQLYQSISARFSGDDRSLIPEFEVLVNIRDDLDSEVRVLLNGFFEKYEDLFFTVLGQDFYQRKMYEAGQTGPYSCESVYREYFGYSEKEIAARRRRNWREVNEYILNDIVPKGFLTVDDLRQIQIKATKGVIPGISQGFRFDPVLITEDRSRWYYTEESSAEVTFMGGKGVPQDKVEDSLQGLVAKANKLIKTRLPQPLKEVAMGNLFAEYLCIHPSRDGNGTTAVFFIEALKSLQGDYTPPEKYDPSYKGRVTDTFNGNMLALGVAYSHLQVYTKVRNPVEKDK